MKWLKKSFNESWDNLTKPYKVHYQVEIRRINSNGGWTPLIRKGSTDFNIAKTNKGLYDQLMKVRTDIKSDYVKLSATLGDVMNIAKSGESCADTVTKKLNLR